MEAQLSVRIPRQLERALSDVARARGVKRSRIIREALSLYLRGEADPDSPYARVKELIGAAHGGPPDLASRHREYLMEGLRGD